jgi:hypothetical protein
MGEAAAGEAVKAVTIYNRADCCSGKNAAAARQVHPPCYARFVAIMHENKPLFWIQQTSSCTCIMLLCPHHILPMLLFIMMLVVHLGMMLLMKVQCKCNLANCAVQVHAVRYQTTALDLPCVVGSIDDDKCTAYELFRRQITQ